MGILKQSIEMSMQNIKGNKMRSFLTTLGIIIGVTAVIALITIVKGVSDSVMSQFEDLGAGKLIVSVTGTSLKTGLTDTDISNINSVENVAGVSPTVSLQSSGARNGEVDDISVEGKNGTYFANNNNIVAGRALTQAEMEGDVYTCVIDMTCATRFFFGENPVGQTIRVGGITYTVVGLEDGDANLMTSLMTTDLDGGTVKIPYRNAMKMAGSSNVTSLEIYVGNTDFTDQVVNDVEKVLNQAFNDDDDSYTLINMDSLLDTMRTMESMMTTMLAGIASIALLVGGIGIMNMMLVSVTERTKEIGLRKALGAEPARIQMQFLIESIFLSLVGGIIGVFVGLLISYVAALLIGMDFIIQPGAIVLGVGFSAAIGIIFGWVPAKKASELNPIDALRSE
jgi:putative ABC transport system permease protein